MVEKGHQALVLLCAFIATVCSADPICVKSASGTCLTDPFPAILPTDSLSIFDRVVEITTRCFYDQTFSGLDWDREVASARKSIPNSSNSVDPARTISALLRKLKASHTEYLSNSDQRYWALQSVFSGDIDGAPFSHIGAVFERQANRWFVRSVFEGSPAGHSGLRRGDEIVTVNNQPLLPVRSFSNIPFGRYAKIKFRRKYGGRTNITWVRPKHESMQRAMLRGTNQSMNIFRRNGKRIGYFHLWAGTHSKFQNTLKAAARYMESRADTLVLDIRDGLGGASPAFLDPFFKPSKPEFSKPLYVLINDGTKSGKESLAYILKTSRRATLVGTRTAGYYLGGRVFDINEKKNALYLAVCGDSPVGVPLEGIGVTPDVEVVSPLPYSDGDDPELRKAIELASATTDQEKLLRLFNIHEIKKEGAYE